MKYKVCIKEVDCREGSESVAATKAAKKAPKQTTAKKATAKKATAKKAAKSEEESEGERFTGK